jgi:sugar phosphate isomerase/epimerase
MSNGIDRRRFLQAAGVAAGAGWLGAANVQAAVVKKAADGAPHAKKLGWRLGCQAYTFHNATFYEAMDSTALLGLHYIEAFPWQRLSPDHKDMQIGPKLSAEMRKEVKARLKDKDLKLVNYGVGPANKQAFEFAKDMGIETLVSEPGFNEFDALDKLVEEYQINVAIHDHPKPSPYWSPDIVLKYTKDHNKRIGACCDTGHWMRSNINPVDALKKLEGRIISFHLKDLNHYGRKPDEPHDVPWGTGKGDIKGILTEVKRQGLKPVFSIEYEYKVGHAMPEITECVAYFDKVAAELGRG